MDAAHIRNFSIIAHIDHGKTTLSDRLLHRTGTISDREMQEQLLDSMDLERERGITIKAHPVTMLYQARNGETYELNLIDTPGHVDFSYEVSRSLSACEGALLIIDAAQGVEAQTVANVHLAMKQNLAIIPIINKIDLPHANVALTRLQLEEILAIPAGTAILASAKEGLGIDEILEAIVARIPAPRSTGEKSLQALSFDSYFDTYKGVVTHVRVFNGELKAGMLVKLLHSGKTFEVKEVGSFNPRPYVRERLQTGETGYLTANIKSPLDVKLGDTLTDSRSPSPALPGFLEVHPMVFSGIYPINTADYAHLKANLAKLQLNDSALISEKRGAVQHTETLDPRRVMLTGRVPLNEILIDFHDRIKSVTHGYGSMDYEHDESQESDMVKLDLMVNGEPVDAFSCIVHRSKAEGRGRVLAAKLKEVIPRQQFQVAIQAAIGGKVVARETISALRKDVTAKCYGGDITRKRKLLEKQKEGKKRMKSIGSVHIPQEAFIEVLKA